ncbi:uncharacterized protein LOC117117485 isoform X2 [Anneissia japonica]|uniref:uncharacterized protein LOC117117485 isoform X2 n=1 Tax=Anneissia japonica TaxID=1529436 RepID=UPI00142594C0|nr:uncharacterized protein LOC117117485 isoform X2 [Anneissia japonica]
MADDAAKRREARRRRILQSPEERMRKIAGVGSNDPNGIDGHNQMCSGPANTKTCPETNKEYKVNPETENIPCAHRILDQASEQRMQQESKLTNKKDEANQEFTGGQIPDGQFEQAQKEALEKGSNEERRWSISAQNCMLSIGLGVLLRVVLWLNIAVLSNQSVVVEFLIVNIIIWMRFNTLSDPDEPSRPIPLPGLITTLLLAGVQNPALAVISKIINTVTQFLTNFALFLFSFICAHCLLEVVI